MILGQLLQHPLYPVITTPGHPRQHLLSTDTMIQELLRQPQHLQAIILGDPHLPHPFIVTLALSLNLYAATLHHLHRLLIAMSLTVTTRKRRRSSETLHTIYHAMVPMVHTPLTTLMS